MKKLLSLTVGLMVSSVVCAVPVKDDFELGRVLYTPHRVQAAPVARTAWGYHLPPGDSDLTIDSETQSSENFTRGTALQPKSSIEKPCALKVFCIALPLTALLVVLLKK